MLPPPPPAPAEGENGDPHGRSSPGEVCFPPLPPPPCRTVAGTHNGTSAAAKASEPQLPPDYFVNVPRSPVREEKPTMFRPADSSFKVCSTEAPGVALPQCSRSIMLVVM